MLKAEEISEQLTTLYIGNNETSTAQSSDMVINLEGKGGLK